MSLLSFSLLEFLGSCLLRYVPIESFLTLMDDLPLMTTTMAMAAAEKEDFLLNRVHKQYGHRVHTKEEPFNADDLDPISTTLFFVTFHLLLLSELGGVLLRRPPPPQPWLVCLT